MLEIQHLTKVYADGARALQDVSFEVEDGQFFVVIGLSGGGKSTLLRCINRLVEPTEGRIIWDGVDITGADMHHLRRIRRQIGMVHQHLNLVHRSKVLTNVISGRLGYADPWPTLVHRFPRTDHETAMRLLERLGMADQARKRASDLSRGQQQRVGIARALMQQPRLILADEPVASLDPVTAHSILGQLEDLSRRERITVICSLHHLDLVQRYATQVVGLKDGRVVYRGTGNDVRAMTDERFTDIFGEAAERIGIVEPRRNHE